MSDVYVTFGGDTAGLESALAVAKAQVASVASEMRALAHQMSATGAAADSDLGIKLRAAGAHLVEAKNVAMGLGLQLKKTKEEGAASGAELKGHFAQVREALYGLTSPLRAIRENLGGIAEAFLAAFAVEKIVEFTNKMDELGEKTMRMAHELGVSTEEIGRLDYVAKATGTSTDEMALAMERLQRNIAMAMKGTGQQASALHNLGLSAKELAGLPIDEQMNRIADAVARFGDGGSKVANVMALLGRSGAEMIPVLDKGRAGLDELRRAAQRTGSLMSLETAEAFAETKVHAIELGMAVQGLENKLYSTFRPAIDAAIRELTRFIESANATSVKQFTDEVVSATAYMSEAVVKVSGEAAGAIQKLMATMRALGKLASDANPLHWASELGDVSALGAQFDKIDATVKGRTDSIIGSIESMQRRVKDAMRLGFGDLSGNRFGGGGPGGGPKDSGNPHPGPAMSEPDTRFGAPNKGAAEALSAAKASIDGQIALLQKGLQQKEMIIDAEAKMGELSDSEKLAATKAALDQEYQAEVALLQKEMALEGTKPAQRQQILNKIEQLQAQHEQKMLQVELQAQEQTFQSWQQSLSKIQSAWDGQLRGILAGTTHFGTAFKKILGDMIIDWIETLEKMTVKWVAMEATKTAATTAGNAARTSSDVAAASASSIATIGSILHSIIASAAEAFAGVFGFLAPVMGPAAVGPAVAAQATVMSSASVLGGVYDLGSWSIPSDQFAALHKGEVVIPSRGGLADEFRSIAAGGGFGGRSSGETHVHFNVQAVDAGSVQQFFNRHARKILTAINHGVRTGAHAGLAHIGT